MNQIVDENAIVEGRAPKSYWDVEHSNTIEGFATNISINAGTAVDFKINVNNNAGSDYKVEIFRLGYYGGDGAREVAQWTNTDAKVQPNALFDASRGLTDAGNWSVTDTWNVPADAVSGVYLARLQRLDANGNPIDGQTNQIPFIVRNDGEHHDIVLQTSDTTWQAYNGWAGNNGQVGANLYGDPSGKVDWDPIPGAGPHSQDRAYAVSYNRPIITDNGQSYASGAQDYVFGADYAAIQWLEKNGYDVSYISGVDTDRLGANYLKNYKAFISVGHDEYWSGGQRANVEAARDAGVNLLFWSGNECYWKTRWDTAYSADGTPYRTLVCYKETLAVADPNAGPADYYNLDPSDIWTGTWRDTRFHGNPLAGGGNPADVDPITGLCPYCHCGENQLTGQLFGPDGTGKFGALDVPSQYAGLRVWRDTTVADGGKLDIAPGILGYEWDTSPDDLLRPEGLIKLSGTTIPWDGILLDQGNEIGPGTATHNLSLYRAESGALVFGAGTVFWSWGLSDEHDSSPYGANIANTDLQQFTINMFADMGIQPGVTDAFLISEGLKRATSSPDHAAATAAIGTVPGHIAALSPATISGTATDNDGNPLTPDGKVAVVEVSTDGGVTWRVANTTDAWAHWTYTWTPSKEGTYNLQVRAIDDSLNISNILADKQTVSVSTPDHYSFFGGVAPKSSSATLYSETQPVELGMRFSVDRTGQVTEIKYWRSSLDAGDTDVRDGHLWRADGTLLATVTFTSTAGQSGWQTATLSTPVSLQAGVNYVVSYHTANNYVASTDFFHPDREVAFDGLDNDAFWGPYGVIRSPMDGSGGGNGVYSYGNGMPNQSFGGSNYWVDVTFDPADVASNRAPTITSPAAYSSPENKAIVGTITGSDADGNVLTYAIAGGVDAGHFVIDASTGVLSFADAPDFELPVDANGDNAYQVTVSVSDGIAPAVTKALTVNVTDVNEAGLPSHVFANGASPATTDTSDPTDYELGTQFQSKSAGYVTELRYFRTAADAGDTDNRTLTLWNAAGQKLGQVLVTSGSGATGWQVGTLTGPIAIQANTTYVVSYGTTQNYAFTQSWFTSQHPSSDGVLSGLGGVYATGPGSFPTATYQSTNYWVDVSFQQSLGGSAPVFTSNATLSSAENQTLAGTVHATDADGDAVTYAIAGGVDAGLFTINASTGELRFKTAPDFEAPGDSGANNIYNLTVSASDGTSATQQALAVTVTDVVETGPNRAPTISAITAPATNEDAAAVAINLLAGASDADGDPITVLTPVTVTSSNGTRTVVFTVSAAGVLTLDPGQFGDLSAGQSETVQISYKISDGIAPGVSNTATIVVAGRDEAGLVLTGTTAANTLTGGEGNDQISGLAGNDTLIGNGGSDTLDGGTGTDSINGGAGDDLILVRGTEAQSDTIVGGTGTDTLRIAGTGVLTLNGTASITGVELIDGGGNAIQGTSSANLLDLSGFTGVTGLTGVRGLAGNDTLIGSAFADTLDGGAGTDSLDGGAGNDTILVRTNEASADTIAGGSGTDTLKIEGTAALTLNGTAQITGFEALDGGGLAIQGTAAANVLDLSGFSSVVGLARLLGLSGNDSLVGSAFADTLDGGANVDTVRGGGGDDTIRISGTEAQTDVMDGGAGNDTILVNAAGGDVFLFSSSRLSGIEHIEGSGVAIRATTGADTLDFSGMSLTGVSAILGLSGNDTLGGGTGNDTLTGGSGNDSFAFHAGVATGDDRITDFDASGNDVIRLIGYASSVNLAAATSFNASGALINLDAIGGDGSILLAGVTALSFTTEDFIFA